MLFISRIIWLICVIHLLKEEAVGWNRFDDTSDG